MDGTSQHSLAKMKQPAHANQNALVVSTYVRGAMKGRGLGTAGYSYEFVRQLFLPLMKRWGEVVLVANLPRQIEAAARQLRERNLVPIHLGFVAVQDMYFSQTMPNVVVPAWEFPDVPNVAFDGNPQNDWVAASNFCDMILAHVPFTAKALVQAGVTARIREVPVPMPDAYLEAPLRESDDDVCLDASGYAFAGLNPPKEAPAAPVRTPAVSVSRSVVQLGLRTAKKACRFVTPQIIWFFLQLVRQQRQLSRAVREAVATPLTNPVTLSGVVYTSIFNPGDGRKNWSDLITGFVNAMKDYDDATLVLKLVTNDPERLYDVMECYRKIITPHRCRIVIIQEYLSDKQMLALLRASSYYVTTTRAEGNCLPLMNYLAAGRPGISPSHSAIGDYFNDEVGFVVESHPEPASFPHEINHRYRTTWARLVWPSLIDALRKSYWAAKHERKTYERLSQEARSRMRNWLAEENVYPLLKAALDAVASTSIQANEDQVVRRAA